MINTQFGLLIQEDHLSILYYPDNYIDLKKNCMYVTVNIFWF